LLVVSGELNAGELAPGCSNSRAYDFPCPADEEDDEEFRLGFAGGVVAPVGEEEEGAEED
jgi:hypothetical protein